MDGHIPYMMNDECELKFFGLEPSLQLNPTLEPKLIFQELVLFQEDLIHIHLPRSKLNHIVRMTVMMKNLLRKLYMCMKCANFMMILYVWVTCLEMIWLHIHLSLIHI